MPAVTSHAPGTPSWVDLGTPDVGASAAFYGGLLGWEVESLGPEAGGYAMARLGGRAVAGLGPQQAPGGVWWSTYVTVADADAAVATARDHGGAVVVEPMDVLDAGRMAVLLDPAGAAFSVWMPRAHIGAEIVNEPGALCWNELTTRAVEGSKAFYGALFGWQGETHAYEGATYTEWHLGDRVVGGMIEMDERWPADVPPHWMVYFAVDDCDASTARVADLGGAVSVPPTDIPAGRFAVCNDPHGAVFSVIRLPAG